MICPPQEEFKRQAKAAALDPWFILHLLLCEDCCESFVIRRLIRRVTNELMQEEESNYWESLDPLARDWMIWMSIDLCTYHETMH